MKDITEILTILQSRGCRLTPVRRAILKLFISKHEPLSSRNIQEILASQKMPVNKTTVYRELDFLKNQKIIEEFQFNDRIKRYEIISGHHHHLVCIYCNKVECVVLDQDLEKQEKKIAKDKNFKIINHSLEFYGVCRKCQITHKRYD